MMEKSDFERILVKEELLLPQVEELEEVKVKIELKVLEDDLRPIEIIYQPDLNIKQDFESDGTEILQSISGNEGNTMADQLQAKLVMEPFKEDEKIQMENEEVEKQNEKVNLLEPSEKAKKLVEMTKTFTQENDNAVPNSINRLQEKFKTIPKQVNLEDPSFSNHVIYIPDRIHLHDFKLTDSLLSSTSAKLTDRTSEVSLPQPPARDSEVNSDQQEILLNDSEVLSVQADNEARLFNKSEILSLPTGNELQCKWKSCYQTYDSQTSLVKHIEKNHVQLQRGEEFTCFWINCPRKLKPYTSKQNLLIHMRVHSGEKPYKCPFQGCSKAFSQMANLSTHQRSHTGEKRYVCQFPNCSKRFTCNSNRIIHQRKHHDTIPYTNQVTGCSEKYTNVDSIQKHEKSHTGDEQLMIKSVENEQKEGDFVLQKSSNRLEGIEQQKTHYDTLQCKWDGCCKTLDSQTAFVKHIENDHIQLQSDNEFTCLWNNCPRKLKPFTWRCDLLLHMRIHSGEKPYKCAFQGCNKAFSLPKYLAGHQRLHTGERPYQCQYSNCSKKFCTVYDKNNHQRLHYNPEAYTCQVTGCLKKYTSPGSLSNHMKIHTVDEQLKTKQKLVEIKEKEDDLVLEGYEHQRTHYDTVQCKWNGCCQTYNSQTALVKHIKKNHIQLQSGRKFTCFWNNCPRKSKPFLCKSHIVTHMRMHTGEKPHKCPFQGCNKAFSFSASLKNHQKSHRRTYLCQFSICLKSFSHSSDMQKHERMHYNPLQCKWKACYQTHDSQMTLVKHIKKKHIQSQSGKEFTCFWNNCPRKSKPFNWKYGLLLHMRIHTGEKPYKCVFQDCKKAFSRLLQLRNHQRRHTGEKPYQCQFSNCFERFCTVNDKNYHQRLHYNPESYACRVTGCSKKYIHPCSLRKHMKIHTVGEQLEAKWKLVENKEKEGDFVVRKSSSCSDGNKLQRTHYNNEAYTCQVIGCSKVYADLPSLQKHVENHTVNKELEVKQKSVENGQMESDFIIYDL